jgi:acetolactate synthase-1/3 small subunit
MTARLTAASQTHTLSVFVANKPGVLARIAQIFSRRGFNIDALSVSPSTDGHYSRMTISASGDREELEQIIHNLNKLVDVLHCVDHTGEDVIAAELALIKVEVEAEQRGAVLLIAEHFECKTVDLAEQSMTFMATGDTPHIDAFVKMLHSYRVTEVVRTGKVIMARGDKPT